MLSSLILYWEAFQFVFVCDHRRNVTSTPTFWTGGTGTPTFQDTGEEFADIRDDAGLNYTKTDPAR